jgi:hypothetical protein
VTAATGALEEPGRAPDGPAAPVTLTPAASRTRDQTGAPARERGPVMEVVRPLVGFVANVTVLTALLVYFGWRRSETHARRLGIDESVLGMSTRDYALRSVGPVLVLLVGAGACGLVWVAIDRRLAPWVAAGRRGAIAAVRALGLAWLVLPVAVVLLGPAWPAGTFVLFPASIGVGALLYLYGRELRLSATSPDDGEPRRSLVARTCVALLVALCLFWTASNYAEVLGARLARDVVDEIPRLPGVAVFSEERLYLDGPGVVEIALGGEEDAPRYRYEGLRLLEHTGGRYFLVSDQWSPTYGVVFVVRDDDDTVRLDFVRDLR